MRLYSQPMRSANKAARRTTIAACALGVWMFTCATANSATASSTTVGSKPPEADAVFAQANQAYSAGNYASAVRDYRALLAQHGYSVAVLFNLGNAWSRLNQPSRAILSYERALWLAPADRAIATNLRLAQRQAAVPEENPSRLDQGLGLVSLDWLGWVGTAAMLTLAVAVLMAHAGLTKAGWARRSVVALCALVLIAAGAGMLRKWPDLDRAVVLVDAAPVRIAPAETADVSFLLKSGSLVHAGERYGDYVMVHAGDGRAGWVSSQQVVRIVPTSHRAAIDDWGTIS
jgi:tetratricopeptide (TPR) repeat protein